MSGQQIYQSYNGYMRLEDENGNPISTADMQQNIENVALSAVYDLIPANGRTFTSSGGSVAATNREFVCSTGTTVFGYGTLQSFRAIQYRPGSQASIRFAARFPDSVASSWVGVGAFTIGDECSFGYNGTAFGVWHRYGGKPDVHVIQITTPAAGNETVTLTLNGVAYSIPVTTGTVQFNADQIAEWLTANVTAWYASQNDDTVEISATSDGAKAGTYSLSSTGATAATITQTTAGVTKTSEHVPQADWNGSTPPSFDPTLGNNYQIKYANGYGPILYYVMNSAGSYTLVHSVQWPSASDVPNFLNPSMHIGAYAASIGSTTDISVYCGQIAAWIDDARDRTRNPRAESNTKGIATTLTNLLTIRNRRNYNGLTNQSEIAPLSITIANDGAKSAVFEVRSNATIGGVTNFQDIGTNLISEKDTAGTTVTGGTLLGSYAVAKGQSQVLDISNLGIRVPPTLRLTVCAKMASGSAADLSTAIVWYEDI